MSGDDMHDNFTNEIPEIQGTSLETPKNHQRSDSSYSRNYSLLDIYGTESPSADSSPVKRKSRLFIDTIMDNKPLIEEDINTPVTINQAALDDTYTKKQLQHNSGATDETFVTGPNHLNGFDSRDDLDSPTDVVSHTDAASRFDFTQSTFGSSQDNSTKNEQHNTKEASVDVHNTNSNVYEDLDTHSPQKLTHEDNDTPVDGNLSKNINTEQDRENYLSINKDRSLEDLLESDFDKYGFKKASSYHNISKEEYNEWLIGYNPFIERRKKKWELLMKSHGLTVESNGKVPTRFPPKSDRVKKMIRKGIPAEWRGNAWFFYAGGYDKLNKNVGIYDKIVKNTKGIENKDTEVIERDLNRTFPDNIFFNKFTGVESSKIPEVVEETAMIKSLRRVLIAFAHFQPQIGYCQSLNFLAGLLLIFMSEEHSFWMLVILTERIIPKVHSANLEGVHTDQGVLMLCVKEYIPQLWSILGKNFDGETLSADKILSRLPPVTLVTSSWFMSLFVGILPFESLLRVWDILWYEGSKTIFRISLTIFKLCFDNPEFQSTRGHSGGAETEQIELFQFMQNFPKTIIDPDSLIDHCFKKIGGYGFGSLSQDEINKCREFVSKQRTKLQYKKNAVVAAEMTEDERQALNSAGSLVSNGDEDIHDIYGFHRSIMSGVAWNKNISNKMKKKFTKKQLK